MRMTCVWVTGLALVVCSAGSVRAQEPPRFAVSLGLGPVGGGPPGDLEEMFRAAGLDDVRFRGGGGTSLIPRRTFRTNGGWMRDGGCGRA